MPSTSPPPPLRTLLVGCGAVSERLYMGVLQHLEAEGLLVVAGLVDPSERQLGVLGAAFPRARRFGTIEGAFAGGPFDLAIIASPPQFHRSQAIASLEHGCHVLCEKPFALTVGDCSEMIREADARGLQLAIGHFRRHYPSVQAIGSLLAQGVLGRPLAFVARDGAIFDWPLASPVHGGVLSDLGPHALDLLTYWLGTLRLEGYDDDALGEVEANCRLDLSAESGARGVLHLSRDTRMPSTYVVTCERGWVAYHADHPTEFTWSWTGAAFPMTVRLFGPDEAVSGWRHPAWGLPLSADFMTYFAEQVRNLAAAIRGDAGLVASAGDARDGVGIIQQCYASRVLADQPWLSDEERAVARARTQGPL